MKCIADNNKGFTLGLYSSGENVYLHKSSKAENTIDTPDLEEHFVKSWSRSEMALKTQMGLTFTNGQLTDIRFCNKDGCSAKFEDAELEQFNFSLAHYDEPMELRVMGKNNGNDGTFSVFSISVYDRDICQGLCFIAN